MNASTSTFSVTPADDRQTLAAALRRWLPGRSWGEVRQLVRSRLVLVNRNLCLDDARRLTAGETVELLERPSQPAPRTDDVTIRHVDRHVVVVEKPAGIAAVRYTAEQHWPEARKQLQPTLEEIVAELVQRGRSPRRRPRGRPAPRLRVVHRLDRDTSGVMLYARSELAQRHLIQQFRRHTVRRCYYAVVHGHPRQQSIESFLVRDRGDGRRGSAHNQKIGKRAVTHVRPLERLGAYSLIECRLETGRTHQIRIHLSEQGHAVCGDKRYRSAIDGEAVVDESGAPRQALHAAELGFEHPVTGERLDFTTPLPPDLEQFLQRLRGDG